MKNGGNLGKETMSRTTQVMLTLVVQVLLTTTPAISEARRIMDLNYDDTRFHLQEEFRHVDPQEAQVRLSMFVTRQLQSGSSGKETVRRVLHHALQEHRRRLPDVRRQVTPGGTLNTTSLKQWFSACVHRQAANSYFHTLPLVDNQKAAFVAKFLNSTSRRRPLDRVKVGLPAAETLTEGGFSRPRESHRRIRRDGPAVMYLPVGAGGSSSNCPDSVDAAAVSISQLVFLSLSLGVFTAVANIANNINNNNNNNNNNNDNNINSNNLNFAASANSGNQITVQLPPPTGRGRRDLHELWQEHLAALRHRRGARLLQSTIKRTQRKRREVGVTSRSFAEVHDSETPSRGADGNTHTVATNQPRMDLNYDTRDINYDTRNLNYDKRDLNHNTGDLNIIEREKNNIPLGLSHFTKERSEMSLTKKQTETSFVEKEIRHTSKEPWTRQDDLGSPLSAPVLEEHYQGILQIANRHGYFLPFQEVPRLLRRLYREHNPTETSAVLSLSDDDELTTAPTVARPTRTSSTAAPSGDLSRDILGNSTVPSGRYSTESETSLEDSASADSSIVASANLGENDRIFHPNTLLETVESNNVSQVPLASLSLPPLLHLPTLQSLESRSTPLSQNFRPSPSHSTKNISKSPPSAVDASSSSRSSMTDISPLASSTDVPPSSVSMAGVGATWALKAAMTWSVWASLSSPPCLGQYLCQLLQVVPKGSTWSHALAGYYLQTSLACHLTHTFTDYLREARLGRCRHLFPDCRDPPSVTTS